MKTAISIPDELFSRAERLARACGKSRSELYREALAEYLLRRDSQAITQAMDKTLDEVGLVSDPWSAEAARQTIERSEW